ncbi:MAG: FecR family protein, partial [Terracidiphilus sp.]
MYTANASMGQRTRIVGRVAAVASALFFGLSLFAQDASPTPPPSGPQARAVRLSSVEGQVQLAQGNQILASQALANTPLFEGTQISTSDDGRAEIQFEDGSVARVSPNSSITLSSLGQQGATMDTELTLNSGLGYFEIQGDSQNEHIRVHFGDSTVTASGFTVMRVNLDYAPGEIAVFSGNIHAESGSSLSLDLHGGESVKLNGPDSGNYVLSESIEPDSWDAWNSDRDQVLTAEEASRTSATNSLPNNNNPAWSDLDANGNWYNMPGQGYVWSPNEAASGNWDPYGCGSWMWTPNAGYMWVSCESWGFMPYA